MRDLNQPRFESVAAELPSPASAGSASEPPSPPAQPPVKPRRWLGWVSAGIGIALVATVASVNAVRARAKTSTADTVRTATVLRRDFIRSLRLNGTVEATQYFIVAAPALTGGNLNTLVITKLPASGQAVHKGEVIVEFDRQNQITNALDRQSEYNDLVDQIKKKQADHANARAKDDTELTQAEDAAKSAELETHRNEVISKIDAEKNLTNLEEAQARLKQLKATYELKRAANQAELRVLEIQRDRAYAAMQHAQRNAERMEVRAPMDGIAVLSAIWKGGQSVEIMEGDEIRSGQPFMQVMDPKSMQMRARVNQADIPWLHVGQPVDVHLDAYPGLVLPGRVERVSTIGLTSGMSNRVRTFTVLFAITGTDPKLMPDLTASADVELGRVSHTLVVPRDALMTDAGGAYVWVRHGQTFDRVPVTVAGVSDLDVALESGVDEGAVVLRNPGRRRTQ